MDKNEIIRIAILIARDNDLDPALVIAIIEQESGFNPWAIRYEPDFFTRYVQPLSINKINAISPYVKVGLPTVETERRALSTSFGLMQVMGMTARESGFDGQFLTELCDVATGIKYGCLLLKSKIGKYGPASGIAAYNTGKPVLVGGRYKNQDYVNAVTAKQKKWREELGK